jgi:eukaryotic-like serine/threonine-protein kinase
VTAETALSPAPEVGRGWVGRTLDGRYRIDELLGEGGMGAVYTAEQLTLHKPVAIKVIRAELAGNGEVAARFAREAMATAHFEHPNVASAIDYGTLPEGGAYLVMQLVRGRNLRDILERTGPVAWPRACELMAQVADALSAARAASIVHRDLKPENMLIEARDDGSELVKVLDFGIAHVAPRKAAAPEGAMLTRELTRVGTVMGTPGYMAPEQAVGDKVDHRTDLYALGVVLWECVTGRSLWDGPDVTSIITQQMTQPVPLLRDAMPSARVPRELDALVQRLCARAADGRPEHAGQVRDELRRIALLRNASTPWIADVVRDTLSGQWLGQRRVSRTGSAWIVASLLVAGLATFAWRAAPHSLSPVSAEAEAAKSAEEPTIPAELTSDVQTMLDATKPIERRKAAGNVLAYTKPDEIPAYVRAIAKLESARTCRDRKEALTGFGTLTDIRTLPPLRRLFASPRSGCGFLDLEDCNACLRTDLRQTIDRIERATAPTPAP